MNRRSFVRRLLTGAVGGAVLSRLPFAVAEPIKRYAGLTYQGIALRWDPDCPRGQLYCINPSTTHYAYLSLGTHRDPAVPLVWRSLADDLAQPLPVEVLLPAPTLPAERV